MSRFYLLCVLMCLPRFILAQNPRQLSVPAQQVSSASAPSSAVQIVYVIDGSTLITYNINPETLQATQMGTVTLPQSVYPDLVPSPNGKFIYYWAFENNSQQGEKLYVYPTNASGVPSSTPVQTLNATGLEGIVFNPSGKSLYADVAGAEGPETTAYAIARSVVDPSTGKLSQPAIEAKYQLESSQGGEFCSLGLLGINPAGTELYDQIPCSSPFILSATYNERAVNPQTGSLGPDVQIYSWNNNGNETTEFVDFVRNLMFDFFENYNETDGNSVTIYEAQPNVTTPLISCAAAMYAPCGDFISVRVHPSAEYVFLTDPTNTTDIGKVNYTTRQISGTSSIPYEVQAISPDGTIAYGANDVNGALDIEIYGFNTSTGAVTQGGTISVPSDLDLWIAAERY